MIKHKSNNSFIGGGDFAKIDSVSPYGVVIGGRLNTIQDSCLNGYVGGGDVNLILEHSDYASIPGGLALRASGYNQLVGGRFNIIQGSSTANNIIGNDRLFILGNGTNDTVRSNAFEVSNNGHSIVFHKNDSVAPSIKGATFTDNIIYAWAWWDFGAVSASAIVNDFGVDTIVRTSTGVFLVTLKIEDAYGNAITFDTSSNGQIFGAVNATLYNRGCGITYGRSYQIIGVRNFKHNQITHKPEFEVYINKFSIANGDLACDYDDADFMFIVTGRPH